MGLLVGVVVVVLQQGRQQEVWLSYNFTSFKKNPFIVSGPFAATLDSR